jgi:hypothetical protein
LKRFHYIVHVRSIVGKLWPATTAKKIAVLLVLVLLASSGGFIAVFGQTGFHSPWHIMYSYRPSRPQSGPCEVTCLRDGCHTNEFLVIEPITQVGQKYKFNHRGHIDMQLGGIRLLCTTCHSRFEGREHFKVDTQTCFICHFLKARTSPVPLVETNCRDCHDVPAEVVKRGGTQIDHRRFADLQLSCEQLCHDKQMDPNTRVADTRCLDCHEFRNQGEYGASDLHAMHGGKGKVDCLACHERVDHGRRPIDGHHTSLKCESCHQASFEGARSDEVDFIRLPADCTLCHSDPHGGQFTGACQQCHSEHGWTGRWVAPSHGPDSPFPLRGEHANVRCDRCHRIPENGRRLADAQFAGLGRDCRSCHTDPHAGQMSSPCSTCHTETGWTGRSLAFSHDRNTSFPLDALHSTVACDACHGRQEKRYRALPRDCGTCHSAQQAAMQGTSRTLSGPPDPHNGRLSCTDCHEVNKPRQRPEEFAAKCATCHNARYGALFYSWASALDRSSASIEQHLKSIDDPNDTRGLQLRQMLEDAASAGFHNLNLAREILRAGTPTPPEHAR